MVTDSVVTAERKWYVVRTYSQHEKKVKTSLEQAVVNLNLQNRLTYI